MTIDEKLEIILEMFTHSEYQLNEKQNEVYFWIMELRRYFEDKKELEEKEKELFK